MGEALVKYSQAKNPPKPLNEHESRALEKMQAEAKAAGATLESDGKGGLPASWVLGIFRRDGWHCKKCGLSENLTIHHKGGVAESQWLSDKGHHNDSNNFTTLCSKCHDAIHNEAREEGTDSSQVTPEGDKGTKRDHGLPDANPPEFVSPER